MSNQTPMSNVLSVKDWNEKFWKSSSDNPSFHVSSPHRTLIKYYNQIFKDDSEKRVFIPLCGKSLDMLYLTDQGHEVVGVEFSDFAVKSFFEDSKLDYTKEAIKNFVIWKSKDPAKNVTIYQGDFYEVESKTLGFFDVVWDRGSFTAINIDDRELYTDIMFQIMKPSARYLVQVCKYDGSLYGGPPHYVTEHAMKSTFGRKCNFEKLETRIVAPPVFAAGIDWNVAVYLLQLKESCSL